MIAFTQRICREERSFCARPRRPHLFVLFTLLAIVVLETPAATSECAEGKPITRMDGDERVAAVDPLDLLVEFTRDPTSERASALIGLLRAKLQTWDVLPRQPAALIIRELGDRRVEAARSVFAGFLSADTSLDGATFLAADAAMGLGNLGGSESKRVLLAQADSSESPVVLSGIAVGLGQLEGDDIAAALEVLARHRDPEVAHRAMSALSEHCAETSTAVPKQLVSSKWPDVRAAAVSWFASCGSNEDEALVAAHLDDPSDFVQGVALKSLIQRRWRSGCVRAEELRGRVGSEAKHWLSTYLDFCGGE